MKKDNIKDVHALRSRLRVASINHLRQDKNSDSEDTPTRESNRPRSEDQTDSDLPQFYHHPRRPRNFDPL